MQLVDHLEKLVPFKAVADAGSFSQAARILRVSQPSLTKTVQQLEAAVGASLFLRQSKGVRLTEAGKVLYKFAEAVIKGSGATTESIRDPGVLPAGELTMATYAPLAAAIYPRIVRLLDQENPMLRATMRTHISTAVLLAWLSAREVDIAFVAAGKLPPAISEFPFETVTFGFFVAGTGPRSMTLSRTDLQRTRLVYMGDTFAGLNRSLTDVMIEAGLHGSALLVDSHEIARAFALSNSGIAVLPNIIAAPYVEAKALRRVPVAGAWAKRLGEHQLVAVVRADEKARRPIAFFLKHFLGRRLT